MRCTLTVVVSLVCIVYTCNAQDRIFWSDVASGRIMTGNIDGTEQVPLLAQNNPQYHAVDTISRKIYWTDIGTNTLYRINYNGSERTPLVSGLKNPAGIALSADLEIYLLNDNKIQKYDTLGNFIATIHQNIVYANDLAIGGSSLYWSNSDTWEVFTSDISGANKKVVLTDAYSIRDIEVDVASNKIYWVTYTGAIPYSGIYRANLNGSNRELLIEQFAYGIAVDGANQVLYWAGATTGGIMRSNLNDLTQTALHINESFGVRSMVLHPGINRIFYINKQYGDFLFSANISNGESRQVVAASSVYYPSRFAIDTSAGKIYWINSKSSFQADISVAIMRANLDGTGIEKLLSNAQVGFPFGLVLDVAQHRMYWTDRNKDHIASANLDGTDVQPIVNGLASPNGLTIDQANGKLYWTDWGTNKVQRSNLDGSDVEDVVSGLSTPYDVEVLPAENKVYWTEYGNGTINRASLDGSDVENVINTGATSRKPNGLFIDVHAQKLYYTIDFSGEKIQRANLDGSEIEDLIVDNAISPHDVYVLKDISSSSEEVVVPRRASVYPNPCSDVLFVQSEQVIASIALYDILGRAILEVTGISHNTAYLNQIEFMTPVVFVVRINFLDGTSEIVTVIRKK